MSRKANTVAAAVPAIDTAEDDLDAYMASINEADAAETEAQPEPEPEHATAVAITDSKSAFHGLRDIIAASDKRGEASAKFNGRYRSGVFSPDGREALYPYIGARRIYPEGMTGVREKLEFVQSMLPSADPVINLLPVDLARLALASGIVLPPEYQPETLKATLMASTSSSRPSGDEWA